MRHPKISLSISAERKAEWERYAQAKGFRSVQNMIVYAVEQCIRRNPIGRHGRRNTEMYTSSGESE